MPKGPQQIVVTIATQRVTLYSNGVQVAQGGVSTGVPGHPTPLGVFSIIEKDRYHHSNIYSGAPMPFMQRITWSGVAMHEGVLPGYPASHGCIRLSHDFAQKLWPVTKLGVRVIVARHEVVPVEFRACQAVHAQAEARGAAGRDECGNGRDGRQARASDRAGRGKRRRRGGAGAPEISAGRGCAAPALRDQCRRAQGCGAQCCGGRQFCGALALRDQSH